MTVRVREEKGALRGCGIGNVCLVKRWKCEF